MCFYPLSISCHVKKTKNAVGTEGTKNYHMVPNDDSSATAQEVMNMSMVGMEHWFDSLEFRIDEPFTSCRDNLVLS